MSEVYNSNTAYQTPAPMTKNEQSSAGLAQDFNDFLKLLTTQLQNQDPLSPMDSTEFTNQLVQFSQVEQQIRTNSYLETLVTLQDLSLTSIALGYIGMNVEVNGSEFQYEEGQGAYEFSYQLPAGGANDVKITIYDEQNQVVSEFVGAKSGGKNTAVWDGKDKDGNPAEGGNYRISIKAVDKEGKQIAAQTSITVLIDGIETVNGQLLMTSKDLLIPFGSISSASLPPVAPTPQQQES